MVEFNMQRIITRIEAAVTRNNCSIYVCRPNNVCDDHDQLISCMNTARAAFTHLSSASSPSSLSLYHHNTHYHIDVQHTAVHLCSPASEICLGVHEARRAETRGPKAENGRGILIS